MHKILCLCLLPSLVFAAQMMPLSCEKRLTVKVSQKDMNRIGVEGDRIAQVFGGSGSLAIETDTTQGQIFVKPMEVNGHPISLTLMTESGLIQDLLLMPLDIPAETLILKSSKKKQASTHLTHSALVQSDIKDLIFAMAADQELSGYEKKSRSQTIPVWSDVQLIERQIYKGTQFQGLVLEVTNLSGALCIFRKRIFV